MKVLHFSAECPESSDVLELRETGVDLGEGTGEPCDAWLGGVIEGFGLGEARQGRAELKGVYPDEEKYVWCRDSAAQMRSLDLNRNIFWRIWIAQ